jgi:protein SCO1/2
MKLRPSSLLIVAMLATLLAIAATAFFVWRLSGPAPIVMSGPVTSTKVATNLPIGGRFDLIDHTGRAVSDRDFRGTLMLVYFGYGACPDICPADLQTMTVALDMLGKDAAAIQPLFITVDPERDTVEFMADYISNFHPQFLGLTGLKAQTDAAAAAYRVYHAKTDSHSHKPALVDHSAVFYLMSRDGAYLTMFRSGVDPQAMARTIASYIE